MTKIILKKDIDIEELKNLLNDGIRPILVGEFNDEEVKLYNSLGIYDIASTEEEAEELVKDPAEFKEVIDNNDVKYEEVEHEVKIQRPGLFSKPVKVALASLAVFGITGATITALGSRNNVVKGEDVTLKSSETTDSKATSVKFTVSDLIVLTEANEENALIDTKGTEQKVIASYSDAEVKVEDKEKEKEIKTNREIKDDGTIEYTTPDGNTVATVNPNGVLEIGDQKYDASNVNMKEYEIVVVEDDTNVSGGDTKYKNESYQDVSKNATIDVIDSDKVEDNAEVVVENTITEDKKPTNESENNSEPVQDEKINNTEISSSKKTYEDEATKSLDDLFNNSNSNVSNNTTIEQEKVPNYTNIVLPEEIKSQVNAEAEKNVKSADELREEREKEIQELDMSQLNIKAKEL